MPSWRTVIISLIAFAFGAASAQLMPMASAESPQPGLVWTVGDGGATVTVENHTVGDDYLVIALSQALPDRPVLSRDSVETRFSTEGTLRFTAYRISDVAYSGYIGQDGQLHDCMYGDCPDPRPCGPPGCGPFYVDARELRFPR